MKHLTLIALFITAWFIVFGGMVIHGWPNLVNLFPPQEVKVEAKECSTIVGFQHYSESGRYVQTFGKEKGQRYDWVPRLTDWCITGLDEA